MTDVRTTGTSNFTGGLNLKANAFQLGQNESPDLLDVDVDPRGGVRQRRGVQGLVDISGYGTRIIRHVSPDGSNDQILVYTDDGNIRRVLPSLGTPASIGTGFLNYASMNGKTYLVTGNGNQSWSYDGNNFADLNTNWNDIRGTVLEEGGDTIPVANYDSGSFPSAAVVGSFGESRGHIWVANTYETHNDENGNPVSIAHPSRVRWSYPTTLNQEHGPEDWYALDYLDLDPGNEGDVITAMVPQVDRMVVFKRNSIYGIYGTLPDNPYPQKIANQLGAISQRAIAISENDIYFFSWPEGLFKLTLEGSEYLFEKLSPLVDEGIINQAAFDKIVVGYHDRRVYVSVPEGNATENTATYVYDLTTAAWVKYGFGVRDMFEWTSSSQVQFLGIKGDGFELVDLSTDLRFDQYLSGPTAINSYYVTPWFTSGRPFTTKRWRRPEYAVSASDSYDGNVSEPIQVSVYHDLDLTTPARTHIVTASSGPLESVRGDLVGKAQMVAMKFAKQYPSFNSWELGGIVLKHVGERNRL